MSNAIETFRRKINFTCVIGYTDVVEYGYRVSGSFDTIEGCKWWWNSLLYTAAGCLWVIVRRLGRSLYKDNSSWGPFMALCSKWSPLWTRSVLISPASLAFPVHFLARYPHRRSSLYGA